MQAKLSELRSELAKLRKDFEDAAATVGREVERHREKEAAAAREAEAAREEMRKVQAKFEAERAEIQKGLTMYQARKMQLDALEKGFAARETPANGADGATAAKGANGAVLSREVSAPAGEVASALEYEPLDGDLNRLLEEVASLSQQIHAMKRRCETCTWGDGAGWRSDWRGGQGDEVMTRCHSADPMRSPQISPAALGARRRSLARCGPTGRWGPWISHLRQRRRRGQRPGRPPRLRVSE